LHWRRRGFGEDSHLRGSSRLQLVGLAILLQMARDLHQEMVAVEVGGTGSLKKFKAFLKK
jgi:hypothetical protein